MSGGLDVIYLPGMRESDFLAVSERGNGGESTFSFPFPSSQQVRQRNQGRMNGSPTATFHLSLCFDLLCFLQRFFFYLQWTFDKVVPQTCNGCRFIVYMRGVVKVKWTSNKVNFTSHLTFTIQFILWSTFTLLRLLFLLTTWTVEKDYLKILL